MMVPFSDGTLIILCSGSMFIKLVELFTENVLNSGACSLVGHMFLSENIDCHSCDFKKLLSFMDPFDEVLAR